MTKWDISEAKRIVQEGMISHGASKEMTSRVMSDMEETLNKEIEQDDTCKMSFQDAIGMVQGTLKDVMIERQKKYGHGNITTFGEFGVLVRASDKIERLKNFYKGSGTGAPDETIEDTWVDLANYAIIALMLRRGIFKTEILEGKD